MQDAAEDMLPYERLLGDAMDGDATLFARQDSVEAQWSVVEPILGDATAVHPYGPEAGDRPRRRRSSRKRAVGMSQRG